MSCRKCNQSVSTNDVILCDGCKSPFHPTCAGLSRQEADVLRAKKRKITFFCDKCNVVQVIDELRADMSALKNEIEALKNMKHGQPVSSSIPNQVFSEDDILNEVDDRQRRINNIIIYNLPESTVEEAEGRKLDDLARCLSIINADKNDIVNCYRIGKNTGNRPRLFLMKFNSYSTLINVLKRYKVKDNIYVNHDLTARQRNKAYLVRQECRERRSKGENIKLKYTNGIPNIVNARIDDRKNQ
jgi:hypothetical protein